MRVLLDSNIWRYLIDAGGVGRLVSAVNRSRCNLCVAPASLYEAAHCGQPDVRAALLKAMTLPRWRRLMPEAYFEALEIESEVLRCRPEWKRPVPDLRTWQAHKHDWVRLKGGAWDRIRMRPELVQDIQGPAIERSRMQAREIRKDAASWPSGLQNAPLGSIRARELDAESDDLVEAWRITALSVFRGAMAVAGHPSQDWLGGKLLLSSMIANETSLKDFWLHEVEAARMPRHWLRWAFEFLQAMRKVSDGTPVDCQLGTYLLDVDLFLSADRVLVEVAERCRNDAPFPIAQSIRVPGGLPGVEAVLGTVAKAKARPRSSLATQK